MIAWMFVFMQRASCRTRLRPLCLRLDVFERAQSPSEQVVDMVRRKELIS